LPRGGSAARGKPRGEPDRATLIQLHLIGGVGPCVGPLKGPADPDRLIDPTLVTSRQVAEPAPLHHPLNGRHAVDKQAAVEMVKFVLNGTGEEPFDLEVLRPAARVLISGDDAGEAAQFDVDAGETQTPLVGLLPARCLDDFGVHEDGFASGLGIRGDDNDPLQGADLGPRQAEAVVLVHQAGHLARHRRQGLVENLNRFRAVPKHGIRVQTQFHVASPRQIGFPSGPGNPQPFIIGPCPGGYKTAFWLT